MKITEDENVNALRHIRETLDTVSINMVEIRSTAVAQTARIAELENEVEVQKSWASEYLCNMTIKDIEINRLTEEAETNDCAIQSLQDMLDEREAEITELKRLNSGMFNRLEAHAKARYQGVTITNRQADWIANIYKDVGPGLGKSHLIMAHNKQVRVNRIATGIKNRINDGHKDMAILLCAALMEDTHDQDDRDTEAQRGARPEPDGEDIRGFGQVPYLFNGK